MRQAIGRGLKLFEGYRVAGLEAAGRRDLCVGIMVRSGRVDFGDDGGRRGLRGGASGATRMEMARTRMQSVRISKRGSLREQGGDWEGLPRLVS